MVEAARRIVLLGCAGAGKTTLARRLGEGSDMPVICLDAIWGPERGGDEVERFRALMVDAHAGDVWVSDGNFAQATFDIRLPRADLIVWLDRPRLWCAWRAVARVFRRGEAHRLRDLVKVLGFISGFERLNRPRIEAARLEHGPNVPVVHLRNHRDIESFLLTTKFH